MRLKYMQCKSILSTQACFWHCKYCGVIWQYILGGVQIQCLLSPIGRVRAQSHLGTCLQQCCLARRLVTAQALHIAALLQTQIPSLFFPLVLLLCLVPFCNTLLMSTFSVVWHLAALQGCMIEALLHNFHAANSVQIHVISGAEMLRPDTSMTTE